MKETFIPSAYREDKVNEAPDSNYVNILDRVQTQDRTLWDGILHALEETSRLNREEPHPRIPEEMFRKIYLPMFAGVEEDKRAIKVDYHSWMGVAGDHRTPVDVVDAQGKVLFTVPPIFPDTTKTLVLPPKTDDGRTFNGVMAYASEVARNFPQQGLVAMQAARESFLPNTQLNQVQEYMLLWAPVLGFYGFLEHVEPVIDVHYTLYGYSKYKGTKGNGKEIRSTSSEEDMDDMFSWD